jgi:hypothetical protein
MKSTRRSAPTDVFGTGEERDCPSCSGEDFDPQRLIDELTADAVDLVGFEDPLDAEIAGAAFVSIGEMAGEAFEDALVGGFIPQFEARATAEALAMVLAIGSVAEGRAGTQAHRAARGRGWPACRAHGGADAGAACPFRGGRRRCSGGGRRQQPGLNGQQRLAARCLLVTARPGRSSRIPEADADPAAMR